MDGGKSISFGRKKVASRSSEPCMFHWLGKIRGYYSNLEVLETIEKFGIF